MEAKITARRYHDIDCGHRVYGHEGKCRNLHGHSYRIHFEVSSARLDTVGRVLDFSVIKSRLCMWVENNWDHRFLLWEKDPLCDILQKADDTVVVLPVNPTAENLASYLLHEIGPLVLRGTECVLASVEFQETRKCSAMARLI